MRSVASAEFPARRLTQHEEGSAIPQFFVPCFFHTTTIQKETQMIKPLFAYLAKSALIGALALLTCILLSPQAWAQG